MANSDNGPVDARTVASQLDATDGVILDMLEKDGRATLSHLSEATGLSVSAVQSRVQKLERRGVIRGYKTMVVSVLTDTVRWMRFNSSSSLLGDSTRTVSMKLGEPATESQDMMPSMFLSLSGISASWE